MPITNLKFSQGGEEVRTRLAPSPTGPLHLGTAHTALFNYLFTKHYQGKFILRIEDTDLERSDLKWEKNILEGLEWLGLKWDEGMINSKFKIQNSKLKVEDLKKNYIGHFGPYRQSERTVIYEKYIRQLLREGSAFWCWHTKEELLKEKERQIRDKEMPRHRCLYKPKTKNQKPKTKNQKPKTKNQGIIRLDTPKKIVKFNDLIRGEIQFDTALLGDISLAKDEKTPLYNLAVVIDDYEMQISHIIRGEDHIPNTPKQILISEALGFPQKQYAHLPLILGPDKTKLSKRHGPISIGDYKKQGYLPEAMVNFMALLGWNPGSDREIFDLNELIKEFSLKRVQKSAAIFNIEKLNWMNGYYIRHTPIARLTKMCLPYINQKPKTKNQKYIEKIVQLEQERMKKLSDITNLAGFFFKDVLKYHKGLLQWKNMSEKEIKNNLMIVYLLYKTIPLKQFTKKYLEEKTKSLIKEKKMGVGETLWPLRVTLSGQKESPGPFEIAEILGKERVLKRIKEAMDILKNPKL